MSKNNFTFVKQTPKFLRELQESQASLEAEKVAEKEYKIKTFDDEAPFVVNEEEIHAEASTFAKQTAMTQDKNVDKKKTRVLQNVQKRNKNLLSFEMEEE